MTIHTEFGFVIVFFRKVLFDGKCPICVHEIRLLKRKDRKKQNVVWVDISQDQYQAADHANIDYVTAMAAMHVIDKNGKVRFCCNFALLFFPLTHWWNMSKFRSFFQVHNNIDAFPVMYNAVGLGWIWSFLKLPGMYNLSQKAYSWYVCIIK